MFNQAYPRVTRQLGQYGTEGWFVPTTGWTFCTGMDAVRTAFRLQQRTNVKGRPAYQLAAVRTDEPAPWTAIGATQHADTAWHFDSTSLTDVNDDYFWIRFGVEMDEASSGGHALFELIPTFERVGDFRGVSRVQIRAETTDIFYRPVTPMLPGVSVSKVKAAIVQRMSSSDIGYLRWGLAYRLAQSDPTVPGTWSDVGTTKTSTTASTRLISDTAVDTSPGDPAVPHQWVQFGIVYDQSAAGDGMTDLTVAIATR